jgi:hypothetical protein
MNQSIKKVLFRSYFVHKAGAHTTKRAPAAKNIFFALGARQ